MRRQPPSSDFGLRTGSTVGFTLVEILIAVSLMTIIIIGLMATFLQVQRSFKAGMAQTDILETGRAVMGLVANDCGTMTASGLAAGPGFFSQFAYSSTMPLPSANSVPPQRVNVIDDLFFTSRNNQDWGGTGYVVVTNCGPAGTLYRWSQQISKFNQLTGSAWQSNNPAYLSDTFYNPTYGVVAMLRSGMLPSSVSRVADGVAHFRVSVFDASGRLITTTTNNIGFDPASGSSSFFSNALPASIEIELGVFEPQFLQRARGLGDPNTYLLNNAAHMHLFRQRIPIRNAELSAYP